MAKSTQSKKTTTKKTTKTSVKSTRASRKVQPKAKDVQKVDFYPNRMTVAISVLAGTLLVLITLISVLGSRG